MLNIFCGTTLFAQDKSLYNVLKSNRNGKTHNIFIVPDRYTLSTEKAIFESLNITSAFDIDVLTLSRLASRIMPAFSGINKTTSIMIIKKILLNNKSKFKCFNKALLSAGFSEDLFNTINQLKSCKVTPDQIVFDNPQEYLQLKMNDIALVYDEYEKYLKDNNLKDSADKFDDFEQVIKNSDFIKNSNIYISHFDSMTLQGYRIVEQLMLSAKSINIAVLKNQDTINSHIYLNDMYNTIVGMANNLNIKPNFYTCSSGTTGQFKHIENNLFSYKPQTLKIKNSNIEIFEHTTIEDELERVATKIVAGTKTNNYKYRDFSLAIVGLDNNADIVSKVFDKFGISYYLDKSIDYSQTIVYSFFKTIFDLNNYYYNKADIVSFVKNIFVGENFDENTFEDFVNKYSIQGSVFLKDLQFAQEDEFFEQYNEIRNYVLGGITNFHNLIKTDNKVKDFTQAIRDIVTYFDLETKIENLIKYFEQVDLQQYKLLPQLLPSLSQTLDGLDQILGEVVMSGQDFVDILNCGLRSINLSTTPLACDSVFVGDASKSLYDRTPIMFVCGANENDLPHYKQDCGIITDNEIEELAVRYQIEPSIKTINQRERFKLFNLLLIPTQQLILSYHLKSGVNKVTGASWVDQIRKMFLVEHRGEYLPLDIYKNDYNQETFVQNLATYNNATTKLLDFLRQITDGYRFSYEDQISTLLNVVDPQQKYVKYLNYDNSNRALKKNLFFVNNTLSVSQIERFYECPFKHFVDYGLKLKQKQIGRIDNLNVGNILHLLAKRFVDIYSKNNTIDIQQTSDKLFEQILSTPEYIHIKNDLQNKMQLVSLKKEASRLCEAIAYQDAHTKFKPIYTEVRFADDGKIKSLTIDVDGLKLKLVGAVDRIDTFEDYFRIIDYKTGNCDASFSQLYYGKKLQLYVYQKVVAKNLKLKPAGVYYLPVSSKYQKDNDDFSNIYQLKGYTLNQENVILASDDNLVDGMESNIVDIKRNKPTKDQQYVFSHYSKLLTEQDLERFADYAIEMLKTAVKSIKDGNINVSPLKLGSHCACDYCDYRGLCRFDERLNNSIRQVKAKVTTKSFEEETDGQ